MLLKYVEKKLYCIEAKGVIQLSQYVTTQTETIYNIKTNFGIIHRICKEIFGKRPSNPVLFS